MLKISLPGFDVKDASPEQLAVDSTFDTLKLIVNNDNPYFGEVLVTFRSNPATGSWPVFAYNHRFDYKPFYYVFLDSSKSTGALFSSTGLTTGTRFSHAVAAVQYFQVSDTPTGFEIDYVATSTPEDLTAEYYSFKYFVFANDGLS